MYPLVGTLPSPTHTGGGDDFAQRVRPMLTILRTNNVRGSGGKGSNQTSTIIILLIIDLTRRRPRRVSSLPRRQRMFLGRRRHNW